MHHARQFGRPRLDRGQRGLGTVQRLAQTGGKVVGNGGRHDPTGMALEQRAAQLRLQCCDMA